MSFWNILLWLSVTIWACVGLIAVVGVKDLIKSELGHPDKNLFEAVIYWFLEY